MAYKFSVIAFSLLFLVACSEQEIATQSALDNRALVTTGELISSQKVTVSPPSISNMWQYKIQYLIPENSPVKEGDVVVRFDPQSLRDELLSKQSELAAAMKEQEQQTLAQEQQLQDLNLALAQAKMDYEKEQRKAEIVDSGRSGIEKKKQFKSYQIAQLQYAQAQQAVTDKQTLSKVSQVVMQAKIDRFNMQVEQVKQDMNKLNVTAKKSGIVIYIADHKGEKVAVGDTLWQGQRVLSIASLDNLAIRAEFDEPDTTKVAVGDKVKVTLDSYPELPFIGQVTSLGEAYNTKSRRNQKVVFEAFISLEQINRELMRPGMKAKVELFTDMAQGEGSHG